MYDFDGYTLEMIFCNKELKFEATRATPTACQSCPGAAPRGGRGTGQTIAVNN